ncbi:STAS domain-containing protein [Lentzea sp. NPDC034063]|uniref:STAS domain-containing protein n=1 Tax=unclassified Lentzea TaxID=2643253 RepID=UPI00340F7519
MSTVRLPRAPATARSVSGQPGRSPGTARFTVTEQLVRRGSVVIAVLGEVDSRSGPVLHTRLQEHVRRAGPDLIADLTAVSFLGIAGLATLMAVWETTVTAEVEFIVVARTRAVLRPLRLTGLDRKFDVVHDLATQR